MSTGGSSRDVELMDRKARVQLLIEDIGRERKKKEKKEKEKTEPKKGKEKNKEKLEMPTRSRKDYSGLHIGWIHNVKGSVKPVTAKKGGGVRVIQYKKEDTLTVESIIELGKKLFFPKGKSHFGNYSAMKVELSTFEGASIDKFTDLDGNECSFQEHLKAQGIYPSQYYIYLKTELKDTENQDEVNAEIPEEEHSKTESVFYVNGKVAANIRIKYTKEIHSVYSGNRSEVSFNSMFDCWAIGGKSEEFEDYNPFLDGYKPISVSVDGKLYYEIDRERNSVILHEPAMDNDVFIYPPHILCGIEEGSGTQRYLILGTLVKGGNDQVIHWFKNNERVMSGIGLSAIKIHENGMYTCGVDIGSECKIVFPPVSVTVHDLKDTGQVKPCSVNPIQTIQPQMEPLSAIVSNSSAPIHLSKDEELSFQTQIAQSFSNVVVSSTETEHKVEPFHEPCSSSKSPAPVHVLADATEEQVPLQTQMEYTCSHLPETEKKAEQTFVEPCSAVFSKSPAPLHVLAHEQVSLQTLKEHSSCEQVSSNSDTKNTSENTFLDRKGKRQSLTYDETSVPVKKSLTSSSKVCNVEDELTCSTTTALSSTVSQSVSVVVPKIKRTDFTIGEELGKGAFGIVRKAEWLGTTVAVKEINVRRMKYAQPLIERELNILSTIRHPNILQLLAFSTQGKTLYLITEYIDGENLEDVIFGSDRLKSLDIKTKVVVATKIIQAIAYLHNQNPAIIHRDIKPENILISKDFRIVKLCDMGLSKLKTFNTVVTTVAGSEGMQPGTPIYQAPELLVERQSASMKSDIWSLSSTLVELFTEEPIWSGNEENLISIIQNKMKNQSMPDGLASLLDSDQVPVAISKVLDNGLSYDAVMRPSALQLLGVFRK